MSSQQGVSLAPFPLDVYDCWRKIGTKGVTFRAGIISVVSAISVDQFIHMIKVVFTNIQSKIKINGFLYDPFTLM